MTAEAEDIALRAARESEVDRGYEFADRLFALVHARGPTGYSTEQLEALGDRLIDAAVEWVASHKPDKARGEA